MPTRDAHGKRLSGAELRKRKAVREAPDPLPKKRAKKKSEPQAAEAEGWFSGPNPFDRLGPPPLNDTAALVTWGAKANALGLEHIAHHPNMYPNRREWIRAVIDGTAKLGLIRDKAAEQSKIEAALHRDDVKGKKQGLTDVRGRKAPQATRPPG